MRVSSCGALCALGLGVALAAPAAAQNKPSIAIMPAQYFSADAESAANLTQGLREQYERQGYSVLPADRAGSTFQSMNLDPQTHYADAVAVRFGRSMGSDLVAYPRLLVVGIPLAGETAGQGNVFTPAAVVHLRVLNVHTGAPIFFRQVGHEFSTDAGGMTAGEFRLPAPVATAAATEVTQMYFQRVAGSRQEFRGAR